MKNINSNTLTQFRKDFTEAMLKLEEEYGVTIKLGTLTYDESSFRGKMSAIKGERGVVLTKEDFKIGEKVKINHKKILPSLIFEIKKINNKNMKVVCTTNSNRVINVSPNLLRKI
jgi:hypothetical protein